MFKRSFLKGLLGSITALFATKKKEVASELGALISFNDDPFADYQKFVNTPYLDRMDFSEMGYDVITDDPIKKFNWINRQVLEFREQEPYKFTGRPLKPMKDCWREAVAEVNAKYGIRS